MSNNLIKHWTSPLAIYPSITVSQRVRPPHPSCFWRACVILIRDMENANMFQVEYILLALQIQYLNNCAQILSYCSADRWLQKLRYGQECAQIQRFIKEDTVTICVDTMLNELQIHDHLVATVGCEIHSQMLQIQINSDCPNCISDNNRQQRQLPAQGVSRGTTSQILVYLYL